MNRYAGKVVVNLSLIKEEPLNRYDSYKKGVFSEYVESHHIFLCK